MTNTVIFLFLFFLAIKTIFSKKFAFLLREEKKVEVQKYEKEKESIRVFFYRERKKGFNYVAS